MFFISVGGVVDRWWKDAYGFKWWFGGGGPIKFVSIDSQKSFMFFAMGLFVLLSVAEKNFLDVNPNFLVPSYTFSQCRVLRQHLIRSIDSRHMVVVDINNVWFPLDLPCLLTESIIVGTWTLLMTQTSLLSLNLVTEMSQRDMKTISPFRNFFPTTCDGFRFRSARKLSVIYVFLFDIYSVSYTELSQLSVNKW